MLALDFHKFLPIKYRFNSRQQLLLEQLAIKPLTQVRLETGIAHSNFTNLFKHGLAHLDRDKLKRQWTSFGLAKVAAGKLSETLYGLFMKYLDGCKKRDLAAAYGLSLRTIGRKIAAIEKAYPRFRRPTVDRPRAPLTKKP